MRSPGLGPFPYLRSPTAGLCPPCAGSSSLPRAQLSPRRGRGSASGPASREKIQGPASAPMRSCVLSKQTTVARRTQPHWLTPAHSVSPRSPPPPPKHRAILPNRCPVGQKTTETHSDKQTQMHERNDTNKMKQGSRLATRARAGKRKDPRSKR